MKEGEKNDDKYLNFPIQLLEGFMIDSKSVLNNIMDYAVYSHGYNNLEFNTDFDKFKASASYYNIRFGNKKKSFENGRDLFDTLGPENPMVGIKVDMCFDYYKHYKTDFQKICLLGFLGIRSILMFKAYCKTTNDNWFSRMDGKAYKTSKEKLSKEIQKFHNEYQAKKIKNELELNWNLNTYSRYTRGFYVSFKLSLNELVFHAEKKRKAYQEKKLKTEKENARLEALKRLEKTDN